MEAVVILDRHTWWQYRYTWIPVAVFWTCHNAPSGGRQYDTVIIISPMLQKDSSRRGTVDSRRSVIAVLACRAAYTCASSLLPFHIHTHMTDGFALGQHAHQSVEFRTCTGSGGSAPEKPRVGEGHPGQCIPIGRLVGCPEPSS